MSTGQAPRAQSLAVQAFQRFLELERVTAGLDPGAFLESQPEELRGELAKLLEDLSLLRHSRDTLRPSARCGERIGPYELLEELGRGGAGVVWRAHDTRLDREVALKLLHPYLTLSAQQVERFRCEAATHARASHPALIQVFDVGLEAGTYYIAQELIPEGRTLGDWIAERGTGLVGEGHDREAAALLAEAARGVGAAHAVGIVHRDLKPANILLDPTGHVHVTDFGLARLAGTETLTQTSARSGTPFYFSPEQAAADRKIEAPSDVFSLGITLYELLTLQRPFVGDTTDEVALAILRADPLDPRKLRPGIPRELVWITRKALELDPSRRYADGNSLAEDLERYLAGDPLSVHAMSAQDHARRFCRRHPAWAITITMGSIGLLSIGWLFTLNQNLARTAERDNASLRGALEATRAAVTYMAPEHVSSRGTEPPAFLAELVEAAHSALASRPEALARQLDMAAGFYRGPGFTAESASLSKEAAGLLTSMRTPDDAELYAIRLALLSDLTLRFESDDALALGWSLLEDSAADPIRIAEIQSRMRRVLRWTSDNDALTQLEQRYGSVLDNLTSAVEATEDTEPIRAARMGIDLAILQPKVPGNDAGLRQLQACARTLAERLGEDHPAALDAAYWLSIRKDALFRYEEAEAGASGLVERATRSLGASHPITLHATWLAAQENLKLGYLQESLAGYRAAIAGLAKWLPPESSRLLALRTAFAITLNYTRHYAEAETELRELISIKQRVLGPGAVSTLISRRALAEVFIRSGRLAEAEAELREQLRLEDENRVSPGDPEIVRTFSFLSYGLTEEGDWEALEVLIKDIESRRAQLTSESERRELRNMSLFVRTRSLQGQGKLDEALISVGELLSGLTSRAPLGVKPTRDWLAWTRIRAELLGSLERYDDELATLKARPPGAQASPLPKEEFEQRRILQAEALHGLGRTEEARATLEALDWAWLDTTLLSADRHRLERIAVLAGAPVPPCFARDPEVDVDN